MIRVISPATHECRHCGALWREMDDGSFGLRSNACGTCCDNALMGEQMVPLTDRIARLVAHVERLVERVERLEAAAHAMLEWDAREQDHAVDFYARMDLCRDAFDKTRAALEGKE